MRGAVFFVLFVFLMSGVLGIESVSPASHTVDFKVGLQKDFVFDFALDGEEKLAVYGDLAKYVELDKEVISGRESVVVSLNFDEKVENYGVNNIWILAGDLAAIVKVNVPYPEKYLDLELSIPDGNIEGEVPVNLKVFNPGVYYFNFTPIVNVYFEGDLVDSLNGEASSLRGFQEDTYSFILNTSNYSSGSYVAKAFINFSGGVYSDDDSFRLGEFGLKILNYTREVEGGVHPFRIEVENMWSGVLGGVYAEIRDRKTGLGFDTSIVSLSPLEKKVLVGYFNTEDIDEENLVLNIDVYYDEKVESKVVKVHVDKFDFRIFWFFGFLAVLFLSFFIWKKFRKGK